MIVYYCMIKPIIHHTIEEKEALEKKLMAVIPNEKRLRASKALMNIFSHQKKKGLASKSKSKK